MDSHLFLSMLYYPPRLVLSPAPKGHWASALSGAPWVVNLACGKATKLVPTSLTLGIERFLPRTAHRFFYALSHTECNTFFREFL